MNSISKLIRKQFALSRLLTIDIPNTSKYKCARSWSMAFIIKKKTLFGNYLKHAEQLLY